jgi:hypothetical protein
MPISQTLAIVIALVLQEMDGCLVSQATTLWNCHYTAPREALGATFCSKELETSTVNVYQAMRGSK